jgi:Cu+-exporting ATPase
MFAKSSHMLYFETCAMLLTIILIGKYIEKKAKKKTSSSLKSLMALQEKNGKVLINNEIVEKSINDINIDDVLIISTGENIPLDGIVISGDAEVNEAMITGESMPVYKKVNDIVLAGTTIVSGNIHLKVNKTNENTYLSLLIKKVEDIQANKPRLQRLADKIASIFVPAVISISLIAFIVTFIINKDLATSINRAIAVLMVSCPCSLGLATPLSILVGSSRAINLQIIYNNTEIFEKASHINTICFDKTGTLSKGTFVVSEFESNVDNALDIIYTLESVSNHPIATSLVKFAKDNNAKLIKELKPKEIIGKGIECDDYFMYKENQIVKLLYKNEVIATLTLKDEIKEEAKEVIKQLHKQNIEVYILTGDSKDIAISVANELNIKQENVFYEIKPEDKLSIIENLKDAGKKVAFVGDGINDALALNKADLSISMGNGSDIAKSSSDITLTNSSLSSISSSIKLSKKVYINIIENFIWAFSYNIVAIPLAFIGILSPLIAGICMAFSNISVVLNALRLYKVKIGEKIGN